MFDSIINNFGLVLTNETFELTMRQRYEEDLFHIVTIETVQMRGTVAAGAGGEDFLTLTFDATRTTGTVQFANTFINVMMMGVRALTFRPASKPLTEAIPDAHVVLQSQGEGADTKQLAKLEFHFVSANNEENELRVGNSLKLNMHSLSPTDLSSEMARFPLDTN